MKKKAFSIIGGDLRSIKLAEFLQESDYQVYIYGFSNAKFIGNLKNETDLDEVIGKSDYLIGPIPCSNDDEAIYSPFCDEKIVISEVFMKMKKSQLFMAGRISEKIINHSKIFDVHCIDLLNREELSVLNAIPTAEGAIQIALEEIPTTLHGSKVLVLGFGRIGKVLAKMLSGIGAEVIVEARRYSDIAWIDSYGYQSINLLDLDKVLGVVDIVFNTVPSLILDNNRLQLLKENSLIIDLASKPGGVDFEAAKEFGVKVIWALSLPGKVAPVTAGKYIKDTIVNILEELGV